MNLEQTIVDENFQEMKQHGSEQFPIAVYEDDFSQFEYGLILWHWHEQIQFTIVKDGRVNFLIGDKEITIEEGEGVFINRAVLHQMQPQIKNTGTVYSYILKNQLIESDVMSTVYTECVLPILKGDDFIMLSKEEIALLMDIKTAINEGSNGYQILVKSKLCSLLYSMMNRKPKTKKMQGLQARDVERVKGGMQYIHHHFDQRISLEDIAESVNISKSELCRCFQRVVHKTPFEYLIRYRILQACNMLHDEDCSITQAALQSGFDSVSHMGRFFHKYMNLTPSQYRKSLIDRTTTAIE